MRTEWIERRSKDPIPTQIYYGRQGVVTEEMEYVARRERLSAETIRDEVARGRMIIPADALGHRRHHGPIPRNQAHHKATPLPKITSAAFSPALAKVVARLRSHGMMAKAMRLGSTHDKRKVRSSYGRYRGPFNQRSCAAPAIKGTDP